MKPTHYTEGHSPLLALLANEYAVRGTRGDDAQALEEAAALLREPAKAGAGNRPQRLRDAIEALSQNRNTVVFDEHDLPSVMVRVPAIRECDVIAQGSDRLHPAFAGGGDILISKYQCSLLGGHACSLPLASPLYGVSLDQAWDYCRRKGKGWTLTPFALRMAIALQCRRRGFLPRGNSLGGRSYICPDEQGIADSGGRVLTGSGPAAWAHDGTADGIFDLNGNLNEWDAGYRLMDGEIQLIPTDVLLSPNADIGADSPQWQAILASGAYAAPGTPGTLKYDVPGGGIRLTRAITAPGTGNCAFKDLQAEEGLQPPALLQMLGLYPEENRQGYELGWRWIATEGERMPLCGGAHRADDHAGVFFIGATYPRHKDYDLTGFRAVYCGEEAMQ